jgi:hypothetical protein
MPWHHDAYGNAGLSILLALVLASPASSYAVPMTNDPKGYQDIIWGSALASRSDMTVAREGEHVREYELKGTTPSFADIPVESVRLSSVDEQFARVMIRYKGEETHKRILAYLEREFGPIERLPGQMMRGLNQQYNWRGPDSEINLTYQAATERGFIFIDSRTLAPRFNDHIADTAD